MLFELNHDEEPGSHASTMTEPKLAQSTNGFLDSAFSQMSNLTNVAPNTCNPIETTSQPSETATSQFYLS